MVLMGNKTATIQSQVFTEVSGDQYKWSDTSFVVEISGGSSELDPPVVEDDKLSVEAVSMSAGETKQVAIVLNNPTNKYAAFQFDLVLPDGISIAKNNKGKLIVSLDEDRKDDHTLNVSETGTNTYRFLAFSMTNTEFYGTDGNKTATIQSQVFTEVSGDQYKWNDTAFQITIEASTGVKDLMTNGKPFDVYNTLGNLVRRNVTTLQGLLAGVYVVNGHKIVVK